MESLTPYHITVLFLSLGILLGLARVLGELAQRFHQPSVLGELLAGVILGPTVLGTLAPGAGNYLFPLQGPNALAMDGIATLAIALFLMVAGIEVDLSTIWRQGKAGIRTGIASILVPFFFGICIAWLAPKALGRQPEVDPLIFALFLATAISISALPIIAKILMDLDLYRSDLGMVVLSAAIFNDLVGWMIFVVVLGLIGDPSSNGNPILATIFLTVAFAVVVFTLGRWLIHRTLPFVQAYSRWPGGELSFVLILALLGAAFSEWIGIHAIFGAFLMGAAVGDSAHLRERTRVTIDNFVSCFFAPVFFASIGLKVNFIAHFNFTLVMAVLAITCVFKLSGGILGARWGGMPGRESCAVGFGMISVGAMGIIVGLIALQAGIIHQELFVALVVMAMVTSMISGPMMRFCIRPKEKKQVFGDVLAKITFMGNLKASTRLEAIRELGARACQTGDLDTSVVEAAVWAREKALSTGVGNGVALPHARIDGLSEALVVAGISQKGIDFDAPDGKPANVLFLILTPKNDSGAQLEIVSKIARIFKNPQMHEQAVRIKTGTEFFAMMNTAAEPL